ncbi:MULTISPECIES: GIY-YIG nuclease family protein [Olsenella]|uniref:GIY-YIG nuclease family protein n=1 Tax=Olsenella TaxID=133925 RepID=UPI0008A3740B|nr:MULTISPECIES: GIY-YIG nuclease family protein [Olsenella]
MSPREGATLAAATRGEGRGYLVYVLRCRDGTLYSGITTDIVRRLGEHRLGGPRAAAYTRSHGVEALVALWEAPDRSWASRLEWRLHHLTRGRKLWLVAHPAQAGEPFRPLGPDALERAWRSVPGQDV